MAGPHDFHPSVLREYDVRGIVDETLSIHDAYALARAFGTVLAREGGRSVCVGRDGRESSPGLAAAVADGLAACGLEVTLVGLGPTPMLYFATYHLDADGGIMVTGSHNPPNYNGFKMMKRGKPFFGADIRGLGEICAAADYAEGAGTIDKQPVLDAYVARLAGDFDGERGLKVAWDAGNGSAGPAMKALTERLPGEHILMFEEVDGRFPNHHPDPTDPETLAALQATVRNEGCDLGIAFDGDGDRIGLIDGRGRILWGDQFLVLLAMDVLRQHPGATIIADVKASQTLFDRIAELGGQPLMWRTGHSLIKAKMAETRAPLAGEMSGHIFFADRYYGYDDALYAAVRLLSALSRYDGDLAQFRDSLPAVVNTPELRFACDEERKFAVIDEVRGRLNASGADVIDVDGVRVRSQDGWWLLRASNTQAVLVARCESSDEAGLSKLKAALSDQLGQSGLTLAGG
ncbi:MAG: phosphomannomutase/phosphoglucomutase [Alphaproteobacteria bacterium]|nr:phosphomannomutase/phosphoglucomutase [Alphaproteobacteria bacterium]